MSITKIHETKIKEIIKLNHDEKFYENHELSEIMNSIMLAVKTECDLETEIITTFITQYLYCGKDGKYFFNLKRRQTKKREYQLKY